MCLNIAPNDHEAFMRHALSLAELSPPRPTNYRVGALLVDTATNTIITTGYTLELPGNTHAEQCCFLKLQTLHNIPQDSDKLHLLTTQKILPETTVLYTTVEPCGKRLSGNIPCVERILKIGKEGIKRVYVGVREPEKFVGENIGRKRLEDAGIEVVLVGGLEEAILRVATAGHTE